MLRISHPWMLVAIRPSRSTPAIRPASSTHFKRNRVKSAARASMANPSSTWARPIVADGEGLPKSARCADEYR